MDNSVHCEERAIETLETLLVLIYSMKTVTLSNWYNS